MRAGDFVAHPFEGNATGLDAAITYCGSNGTITLYPGNSSISIPTLPAGVMLLKYEGATVTALGGGDLVTDRTAALQSAIDACPAGGSVMIHGPGPYLVLGLQGKSGVSLRGDGATLRKNGGGAGTHILNLTGTTTATDEALTVNAAIGDTVLTMASSSGFAAGDTVLIRDATYKYGTGPEARNQELNRVVSTTGTTITLRTRLIGSYATASTAEIVLLSAISDMAVRGLVFEVNVGADTGGAFYGTLCYGVTVENCTALYPNDDPGFYFDRSALCLIHGCVVRDGQSPSTSGYSYGITFADSQFCKAAQCRTENIRENTITDNCRHCAFDSCDDVGAYDSSFNTHGSGNENCSISNCKSTGSAGVAIAVGFSTHNAADVGTLLIGNKVTDAGGMGISVNAPNGKENTDIHVIGNSVDGWGLVATTRYGILIQECSHATVLGNRMNGAAQNNAAAGIYVSSADNALVESNTIRNIPNGYGIRWASATETVIQGNKVHGVSSSNFRAEAGTSTVVLRNNVADDTAVLFDGTEVLGGNIYGTKFDQTTGTATVANGTTSIAVTHNSGTTPAAGDILVTPTNNLGNAAMFWIGTITATQFTINVDVDPGATTATFGWQLNVS
jgi:parallel beta-helix repeat protein